MSVRNALRRPRTWLIGIPILVFLAVVVAPFVYINFIKPEPPPPLAFDTVATTADLVETEPTAATAGDTAPAETAAAGDTAPAETAAAGDTIDGTWVVAAGSQAGYRVPEILFGQDTEAVGRTDAVTGEMTIAGTAVEAATFTVDLTQVSSDESNRDNQFRGRIMDTATYPTATFEPTAQIEFAGVPADLDEVTATATGNLTLRGVTNEVTFELAARRNGAAIEVDGSIPITFADYAIPDASFGPASVGDEGEIEFLLVFQPAG